jgi:hypothetical protein
MVKRRIVRAFGAALAWASATAALAQTAQMPPTAADPYRALAPRVKTTLRFVTDLTLAPAGPIVQVKVYTWHLAPQQDLSSFPLEGAATVEVRAGEVEAAVDSAVRASRREGDHLIVPAGSRLGLRTGNDSATLHGVVVIRK